MALLQLKSFNRIEKSRNMIHSPVNAAYTVFSEDGQTYFQIDTYGTAERVMPEKVSQSIQLDKEMAVFLISMLQKEFLLD